MASTEAVRAWLPDIVKQYSISSICDAGAGDLHWIKHVEWDVDYIGFDLVPRHDSVRPIDITKEVLPTSDAILCRMVFNHLDQDRTDRAIELFKQSGAKYLIANRYDNTGIEEPRPFRQVEVRLGEPIAEVRDGPDEGCYLCLWSL